MTSSHANQDWLLLQHWLPRSLVYFLCSIGIALPITVLSKPNFWTAYPIFFAAIFICFTILSASGFAIQNHQNSRVICRVNIVLMTLSSPGLLYGVFGSIYFHIQQQQAIHAVNRGYASYVEPIAPPVPAEVLEDWRKGLWKNAVPLCLEFSMMASKAFALQQLFSTIAGKCPRPKIGACATQIASYAKTVG